jgi:thymidylate synthase (FAD)
MIVRLIAQTMVDEDVLKESGWKPYPFDSQEIPWDLDMLAEFAGRNCYQSWDRPNKATATNQGYIANILAQSHYSVLEHASATFYLAEVSRSFLAELSRHRHLSLSVLSQRYVDESEAVGVVPPAMRWSENTPYTSHLIDGAMDAARIVYARIVEDLTAVGYTRKQAREAARAVLPNATETKIVVTGNMRTWRELIKKRTGHGVDKEFQLVAAELLNQLKAIAPATFQDMG